MCAYANSPSTVSSVHFLTCPACWIAFVLEEKVILGLSELSKIHDYLGQRGYFLGTIRSVIQYDLFHKTKHGIYDDL